MSHLSDPSNHSSFSDHGATRRALLKAIFMGAGVAAMPSWVQQARAAVVQGEIPLPKGPLSNIGAVEVKTLTSGSLVGVNDAVTAPPGFNVRCVARAGLNPLNGTAGTPGQSVAGQYFWHTASDGGAVFPQPDGGWVYASNCEGTGPAGGVGALRFDKDGNVTAAYPILTGTNRNCAGGATPWGTWLSCEEASGGAVFECEPLGPATAAVRKPALGLFSHEAVAIDPINHTAYLTEDGTAQRFYRYTSSASDLVVLPNGTTRMKFENGTLERMEIVGFPNGAAPTDAQARQTRKVNWVAGPSNGTGTSGTRFNGGEGVWYYEVPEGLREIPSDGSKPVRGVIFFATKGDNRVWAFDIENQLVETIFDNSNSQGTTFDDVDNVTVSPAGDVLVCEDGNPMRIYVIVPNQPAKLLMQITRGGSEIAGAAFTPDGSRLYFSSQRGPSGPTGQQSDGAVYEMTIPPAFRSLPVRQFIFQVQTNMALNVVATSEAVRLLDFTGSLPISVSAGLEYSLNGGAYTAANGLVRAGQLLRVRHTTPNQTGAERTSSVTVGSYSTTFKTINTNADRVPAPFNFETQTNLEANTLAVSNVLTPTAFNAAASIVAGAGLEYRIGNTLAEVMTAAFTRARGSFQPGQMVQVRHTTSAKSLEYVKTTLTIGTVAGSFLTRTKKLA
jgi:hypothetical protein